MRSDGGWAGRGGECALGPARTNSRGRSCTSCAAGALGGDSPGHAPVPGAGGGGSRKRKSLGWRPLRLLWPWGSLLTQQSVAGAELSKPRTSPGWQTAHCFKTLCLRLFSPPPLSFCEDTNEGRLAFRRHYSLSLGVVMGGQAGLDLESEHMVPWARSGSPARPGRVLVPHRGGTVLSAHLSTFSLLTYPPPPPPEESLGAAELPAWGWGGSPPGSHELFGWGGWGLSLFRLWAKPVLKVWQSPDLRLRSTPFLKYIYTYIYS